MRFSLAKLFGGARSARKSPSSRRLTFERYEARRTLCSDLDPVLDTRDAAPPADPTPAEETTTVETTAQETTAQETTQLPTDPIATAEPPAVQDPSPDQTPPTEPYSEPYSDTSAPPTSRTPNQSPLIKTFMGRPILQTSSGTLWEFTGSVEDDQLADGITVLLGGLLDGNSATADRKSGAFVVVLVLPSGSIGTASAIAIDPQFASSAKEVFSIE